MATCDERKIFVLHFIYPDEEPFKITDTFCNSDQDI